MSRSRSPTAETAVSPGRSQVKLYKETKKGTFRPLLDEVIICARSTHRMCARSITTAASKDGPFEFRQGSSTINSEFGWGELNITI